MESFITVYHIHNPIKRRKEGTSSFRRPSLGKHPRAHRLGLQFLRDCRQLGKLLGIAL